MSEINEMLDNDFRDKEQQMDDEVKIYKFEVNIKAVSLDDAIAFLEHTGLNVDDLNEVRWLD